MVALLQVESLKKQALTEGLCSSFTSAVVPGSKCIGKRWGRRGDWGWSEDVSMPIQMSKKKQNRPIFHRLKFMLGSKARENKKNNKSSWGLAINNFFCLCS